MKRVLFFLLFGIVGFALTEVFMTTQQQQVTQKKVAQEKAQGFSLERAPTDSLIGTIASLSGSVQWQSRTATAPATIKEPRMIQQGEELFTGDTGTVSVQLQNGPSILLLPKSHINFIQTLPTSVVIKQDMGTVTYETSGKSPVGVDALSLLSFMKDGKMTVIVNPKLATVSTSILEGSATAAYNDTNNTSSVTPLAVGKTFIFDDDSSTGILK